MHSICSCIPYIQQPMLLQGSLLYTQLIQFSVTAPYSVSIVDNLHDQLLIVVSKINLSLGSFSTKLRVETCWNLRNVLFQSSLTNNPQIDTNNQNIARHKTLSEIQDNPLFEDNTTPKEIFMDLSSLRIKGKERVEDLN